MIDEAKFKAAKAMGTELFALEVKAPDTDPLSVAKFDYDGYRLAKMMGKVALALCSITDAQVEQICEKNQVKKRVSDLSTADAVTNRRLLNLSLLAQNTRKRWSPFFRQVFRGYYDQAVSSFSLDPSMESHELLPYVIKHMRKMVATSLKVQSSHIREYLCQKNEKFRASELHSVTQRGEVLKMLSSCSLAECR
jgi:hypothetical protein